MKIGKGALVGLLMMATALLPVTVEGSRLGKAVARGAARSAAKALHRATAQILRRDLLRDQAIRARPLPRPKTVFRYTSKARAQWELRRGLRPGTHMTSRGGPGRPLHPETAQRRYGLPQRPQVRETIHLSKDQPVRSTKAIGGHPGVGELTSPKPIPPTAIKKVVPLRGGRR